MPELEVTSQGDGEYAVRVGSGGDPEASERIAALS